MRTARLLTLSQHALRRGDGVCPGGGGYLPGGGGDGVSPGGCLPGGGGMCLLGGGVWPGALPEQNDKIGVKTLPCRNFVAGGNNLVLLRLRKTCTVISFLSILKNANS